MDSQLRHSGGRRCFARTTRGTLSTCSSNISTAMTGPGWGHHTRQDGRRSSRTSSIAAAEASARDYADRSGLMRATRGEGATALDRGARATGVVGEGKSCACARAGDHPNGSASGQREPDDNLPVVDLPGALEAELPIEGPRFALARLVTGQQLGGALRPNQVDELRQDLAADPAPLVPLVDEQPPQVVAPWYRPAEGFHESITKPTGS